MSSFSIFLLKLDRGPRVTYRCLMLQYLKTLRHWKFVLSSILINDERYNIQQRNTSNDERAFLCSNVNTLNTTNTSVSLQIFLCIYTSESLTIFKIHFLRER